MATTRSSQCRKKTIPQLKAKPNNYPIVKCSARNLKPLVEEMNYFTASVRMLSSFRVIDEIKKKLTKRQAELFGKTCFGQFLKLQRLQFSGQLVHHILLRQLVCPEKENCLLFTIGGKKCEFGLKDFALITGLDCNEYVSPDTVLDNLSTRIRDKYFHRSDMVSVQDVTQAFRMYQGNSDDDAVKLAQLYLLEAFLLRKQYTHCLNFFIRLVDNADEFNKFPWGRYVHEFTVNSMKHALGGQVKKLGRMQKQGNSTARYQAAYFLGGFPHALQFWALECIPLVREKFGERIDGSTPRMLNWALVRRPTVEDLKNEVFNTDEFQVEYGIRPTEKELHEDYFRYFLVEQRAKKRKRTAITEQFKSLNEQTEEIVTEGSKDYEKSMIGCEIPMNEEGGDNDGIKYNDTTPRKARKKCGNGWNSEPEALRKTIREEISPAFCALRDEIIPILTKLRSNVAETDFDKEPNFEKLKNKVFNGAEFEVENGVQLSEQERREDISQYFSVKEKVEKRKRTASAKDDDSPIEHAEETVTKGKDLEKSENVGEIFMNEEGSDNDGKMCNDKTPRKAWIRGKNDSDSELRVLRKAIREEMSTAARALIDEIRGIVITRPTVQRSNVAEPDFDVVSIEVDGDDNQYDCCLQRKLDRSDVQGMDEIPCFTIDLFEHPNNGDKAEFDEWIKIGLQRNNKRNKYVDGSNELHPSFDFTILTIKKKDWFFSLNETAQWLSSSHIDVALYFIRKKKENHPDVFKHRCTTTDTLFYLKLNMGYLKFKQDPGNFLWDKEPLTQKTVEGLEPQSSLPWIDVDIVYIPVNVNKKHWVVAALDLKDRILHVYNSYHAAKNNREVLFACTPIAEMVPWALKSVGFFDAHNDIRVAKDETAPFGVKIIQDIPQQENGGDCGMFVLKFIEFLMQDAPLDKCNQQEIPFFRNKMAVELYAYAKKRMAKE